jgi:SH3-like domain-containing protein
VQVVAALLNGLLKVGRCLQPAFVEIGKWRFVPAYAGNTLYILTSLTEPRRTGIVIEPQFWLKNQKTEINAIRSAQKISIKDVVGGVIRWALRNY